MSDPKLCAQSQGPTGIRESDIDTIRETLERLVGTLAISSGYTRWYISRIVEDEAHSYQRALWRRQPTQPPQEHP